MHSRDVLVDPHRACVTDCQCVTQDSVVTICISIFRVTLQKLLKEILEEISRLRPNRICVLKLCTCVHHAAVSIRWTRDRCAAASCGTSAILYCSCGFLKAYQVTGKFLILYWSSWGGARQCQLLGCISPEIIPSSHKAGNPRAFAVRQSTLVMVYIM